jgi:pimeloyl-ACP methyl ester carboxylesterase
VLTEPDIPQGKMVQSTGPARAFVDFERLLLEDGFSCLRFDQPSSGNSEGDFVDSFFSAWVETLTGLARRQLDAGNGVALLGQSMGGTATMIAASQQLHQEQGSGKKDA